MLVKVQTWYYKYQYLKSWEKMDPTDLTSGKCKKIIFIEEEEKPLVSGYNLIFIN